MQSDKDYSISYLVKNKILYIELKSGYGDSGPAWIGEASFSKTGTTVYFNNRAYKKGQGISGNHFDIENGDEYWISGIKKNGQDRHWADKGKIMIDRKVIDAYLLQTAQQAIDLKKFEVVEINETRDRSDFNRMENTSIND